MTFHDIVLSSVFSGSLIRTTVTVSALISQSYEHTCVSAVVGLCSGEVPFPSRETSLFAHFRLFLNPSIPPFAFPFFRCSPLHRHFLSFSAFFSRSLFTPLLMLANRSVPLLLVKNIPPGYSHFIQTNVFHNSLVNFFW